MAATHAYTSHNGHSNGSFPLRRPRFEDIPPSINIPVSAGDDDDDDETAVVEIDPDALPDDPTELCTLLENENSPRRYWMHIALAYAKHEKVDTAIEIMTRGLQTRQNSTDRNEQLPMLNCLTWLFLQRSREVGRMGPGTAEAYPPYQGDSNTKDYFLQLATQTLNQSTRLDQSATVNSLARGIYTLFKASMASTSERNHHFDSAARIFDDAIRNSRSGNMLATMGKARVLYGRKRYDKALECYQEVLLKRPDMDPDPRIGIGLCYWSLGYKDDAKYAWERALEIDPSSKTAHALMAAYHLQLTATLNEHDEAFINNYKEHIDHAQKAYKLDKNFPLACTTFASHFLARKGYHQTETLAKKAIEYTDVPAVASDGWYLLARKAHSEGDLEKALTYYRRSDAQREGGYLPALFGIGQAEFLMKDITAAKITFEKIVSNSPKCLEAKVILGTLYAHEVLSAIPRTGFAAGKEDVTELHKKAIVLLESVRNVWKNDKQTDPEYEALLLTLSRLHENDQPEKALQCLQQVEQAYKDLKEDDEEVSVPLQLLNNMAVFHFHQEKYDRARELYQQALNLIPELKAKDESADTDALATTLTYNLARCEEAAGNLEDATKHYEQLLQYHEDYVDANMRLTYMALRRGGEEGPKRISKLMQTDGNNLEVRALYGWYLGKQKRKTPINIAEDPEQRHYKHSLQNHEKHDRYSLTGMGNLYLLAAREMRRESESEREKRRKTYEKAVEFFDKALQLDPKNAYAAQGVAIAMVEDKKDLRSAVGIFTKVRETLANDTHASVNLGHCLAGLEQWGRAIENYESALNRYQHGRDPTILSCLGRVWYAKGKREGKTEPEKAYESLKNSLEYAKKALEIAKDNPIYMFNVAFVQSELVHQLMMLTESQRTLASMEAAAKELDEAVLTFTAVAQSKTPPFPPKDIEARASMGKNTTKKQLERKMASQREYEEKNAAKLAEARKRREEEMRKHQEEVERVRREEEERKKKIAEERRRMQEEAREFAERRDAEERAREAELADEGERKRRRRKEGGGGRRGKKSKSDIVDSDSDSAADSRKRATTTDDDDGDKRPAKKRKKLTRGKRHASPGAAGSGKFKSSEVVNSSDDDDEDIGAVAAATSGAENDDAASAGEDEGAGTKKKTRRRAAVSDDEDEDMDDDLFGDDNPDADGEANGGAAAGDDAEANGDTAATATKDEDMQDAPPTPGAE